MYHWYIYIFFKVNSTDISTGISVNIPIVERIYNTPNNSIILDFNWLLLTFNSIYIFFISHFSAVQKILNKSARICARNKAFRHIETLFIQGNAFILPGPLSVGRIASTNSGPGQIKTLPWMNKVSTCRKALLWVYRCRDR